MKRSIRPLFPPYTRAIKISLGIFDAKNIFSAPNQPKKFASWISLSFSNVNIPNFSFPQERKKIQCQKMLILMTVIYWGPSIIILCIAVTAKVSLIRVRWFDGLKMA